MDTYEYLVKEEISPMSGYRLNEYGDDGWELVLIMEREVPSRNWPMYDHYFKRRKHHGNENGNEGD